MMLTQSSSVGALRGNPRLAGAIRRLGLWDCAVWMLIVCAWAAAFFCVEGVDIRALLLACAACGLILVSSWWGLSRGARAPMEQMMAWVGGFFLLRVLIVAGTVLAAYAIDSGVRWVAISVVVSLVLHTSAEVWVLSRANVATVVPLSD